MNPIAMEVRGVCNRKTVSDLKLKKSLQLSGQDLMKINTTMKVKQAKLTPIIGEITIVPLKPQCAIVKQMLLGKQVAKLQGPLQRVRNASKVLEVGFKPKINTDASGNNNNSNKCTEQTPSTSCTIKGEQYHSRPLASEGLETRIEQQLLYSQKEMESPKKAYNRVKTLPKIQNESKYLTERLEKADRPILTSIDPNLKGIKCLHFFIWQHEQKIPIISHRSKAKIQVASLTKIMTFYTAYKIAQQFGVNLAQAEVTIQQEMTGISGTTAYLAEGQIYTVEQLLYGMMLPSGNDASIALAIWGGRLIAGSTIIEPNLETKMFVERMNIQAKQLKMMDSVFGNPHGLPHRNNRTTCEDMAKLCSSCLEIALFRQIVSTKLYKYRVYDSTHKRKVAFHWQNTNKLLRRPGFIGIKTGITVTAGPCLASAYQFLEKTYIVVVAKCSKPSRRFKETRRLLKYCLERIDHGRQLTKEEEATLRKLGKTNEDIDSDYSEEETQFNFGSFSYEEIQRRTKILTQI